MSLSSMIFPNNQGSGSDDSAGESGMGLDQSMVVVEPSELHAENKHHYGNVWRLYFESSESELENSKPVSTTTT